MCVAAQFLVLRLTAAGGVSCSCCHCCSVTVAAAAALRPPQMPEFHQRVLILQQLGYVSPDGTVTLKGRAACEINSTQVCCCGLGERNSDPQQHAYATAHDGGIQHSHSGAGISTWDHASARSTLFTWWCQRLID